MLFNINFLTCILISTTVCHHATAQNESRENIENNIEDLFFPKNYEVSKVSTEESDELCGYGADDGVHMCVPYHRCDNNTIFDDTYSESEENNIEINIHQRSSLSDGCTSYLDKCCPVAFVVKEISNSNSKSRDQNKTLTTNGAISAFNSGSSGDWAGKVCGLRNINGLDFKLVKNNDFEAEHAEFPWMTAILNNTYDPLMINRRMLNRNESVFMCGGSIITPGVIITAAHCVVNYQPHQIHIRAGEWDTQTEHERVPYQERFITKIIVHPAYNKRILQNDIALLILEKDLTIADNVGTVCLPPQGIQFNSEDCFSTGWGKDMFGKEGLYQVILKKRQLSTVPFDVCERALRTTTLGERFRLGRSFMCAGGVKDIDMCTGDGGGPLVCPDPENPRRYMLAGIVAWGMGCNSHHIPGVYADVTRFRKWVNYQMDFYRLNKTYYEI